MSERAIYGLMGELASGEALVEAAKQARKAGLVALEAYSPYPVEGLDDVLGFTKSGVPSWTLVGGIAGGLGGAFVQWYSAVVDYPINVGGRPLDSWPAFIPAIFECTILGAAFFAVGSMLIANGLPKLRHPVFGAPHFDLASRNRFFLCVRAHDPAFANAREFLEALPALRVVEVPCD